MHTVLMRVGSSAFAGGDDMWAFGPVRNVDGSIDVAGSVAEFERFAHLSAKRDRLLRLLPRTRHRLVRPQVAFAHANWEAMNRQNGF
jgi:hypothetical protein